MIDKISIISNVFFADPPLSICTYSGTLFISIYRFQKLMLSNVVKQ